MSAKTAKANVAVLAELKKGPKETTYNAIMKQIQIIYAQASLRYAFLVDRDLAGNNGYDEHQRSEEHTSELQSP